MSFVCYTLASSNRPNAFNKLPKSLRTQYKSCSKREIQCKNMVYVTVLREKKSSTIRQLTGLYCKAVTYACTACSISLAATKAAAKFMYPSMKSGFKRTACR